MNACETSTPGLSYSHSLQCTSQPHLQGSLIKRQVLAAAKALWVSCCRGAYGLEAFAQRAQADFHGGQVCTKETSTDQAITSEGSALHKALNFTGQQRTNKSADAKADATRKASDAGSQDGSDHSSSDRLHIPGSREQRAKQREAQRQHTKPRRFKSVMASTSRVSKRKGIPHRSC
ncbi:hypothetical protein WJX74_010047 [Apatococcus lobatus]|uniref:Uncharacterized protein n=1 Tax=Apatococcus lobatus TaxID=904363 RepID=A0AAW1RA20_9CHLO